MTHRLFAPLASLVLIALSLAPAAKAQDYSNIRIVRLSFTEGSVQYRQTPGEPWQDANMNLPIQQGFAVRTSDGYAEVEFENALTLRMGPNSTVEFSGLALVNGGHVTRLNVPEGSAIITAKLARADALSVAASGLNVKVPHNGRFRVDASPAESWVTVFAGKVAVDSGSDTTSVLSSGHRLHEAADGSGAPEIASKPPADAFDKWVSQREAAVDYAQNGTADVLQSRNYTEGFADLYNFGLWSNIPGFGYGWTPYGMGPNWMPFVSGQWTLMAGTGWNWISSEPWGWLPYHFGAWVNAPGVGWAWLPVGARSYQPATATWVQVGNRLGWVPLTVAPQSSKSFKPGSSTVILAAGRGSNTITAGERVPIVPGAVTLRSASAPMSAPVLPNSATVSSANPSATMRASTPVAQTRLNHPTYLQAPRGGSVNSPRIGSVPPSLMAPHSAPAPRTNVTGFRAGGFGGSRQGNGGGAIPMSRSASTAMPTAHSGAATGASGGHR